MSEKAAASKGLAFITLAKLYFILMGFVVQLGLPRFLSPSQFGRYALAMSFVSVVNNVLIAATVQSLSKRVSEAPEQAPARLRQGLALQLVIGLLLSGGLIGSAPFLSSVGYDDALTPLLRVVAFVPLFYAVYATLVGTLNGLQRFKHQAFLDMTFSTLRTIGILGLAIAGFGAFGSVSGFAGAAGIIMAIALVIVGIGKRGEGLPLATWFNFMVPVVLFQTTLNGMLLLDVWMLQNTAAGLHIASGLEPAAAGQAATELVGFYKAGQNFALVPYQIILSVTFVIFPLVSRATAEGDHETAREHIQNALRFSVIVLFALAAPLGGGAEALVRLAYPKYLAGAEALSVLVFGQVALALFVIIATILSGAGRPGITVWIGALGLAITLVANRFLVLAVGIGPDTLRTAAFATSLGTVVALLVSVYALRYVLGARMPWLTLARAMAAAAAAFVMAKWMPQTSGLLAPVVMVAAGVVYAMALVVTGELGRKDLAVVLAVVKRRRS